jgi:hypothetical protein
MRTYEAVLTCTRRGRRFRESWSGYKCPACIEHDERRKARVVDKKIARREEPRDKIRSWRAS